MPDYDPWKEPKVGDTCTKNGRTRTVTAIPCKNWVEYVSATDLRSGVIRVTSWWAWCFAGKYVEVEG